MNVEQLQQELLSWPGVTSGAHRFGRTEFRVNGREMGHIHGSSLADLPLPTQVRDDLVRSGKAVPHHILPQSGWVTLYTKDDRDAKALLGLFQMQYERLGNKVADGLFIAFVIIIRLVFVELVFKVIVKGVVFRHATNTAGGRY